MAGKSFRAGIGIIELLELFPDEGTAQGWFESIRWPEGRICARCSSGRTKEVPNGRPMPYCRSDCRSYFSVKAGSVMESSKIPLRKWAIAFYQILTNLKGVSSMKLHRDLGISQTSAWFPGHRIREGMSSYDPVFSGPVEADETYIGGKESNKREYKKLKAGRGTVGKTAVAGLKDRETNQVDAQVVDSTGAPARQGNIRARTDRNAIVCTGDASACAGIPRRHETVKHSVGEFVKDMAHTNGMESFRALLKRGYHGIYHWMSGKRLDRYVAEFEGRHNNRPKDTLTQMAGLVRGCIGKRLRCVDLIADSGMTRTGQIALV